MSKKTKDFVAHNKDKTVGPKGIFTPDQCQVIKLRLTQEQRHRDWLLFSLGVNGRMREGDLLALKVSDVKNQAGIKERVLIRNEKNPAKTQEYPIPKDAQARLRRHIDEQGLQLWDYLFYGRKRTGKPISKRQLLNLVKEWATFAGLDPEQYGTHSLRRTGADYLYRCTGDLRAVQIALAHSKIDTTIRYLGIDRQEVLELSRQYPL